MKFMGLLGLLLSVHVAMFAQRIPAAYAGPARIFIDCGQTLPKGFRYRISRKEEGQPDWVIVQELQFPANKAAWKARMIMALAGEPELILPDQEIIETLWIKLRCSLSGDSLYSWSMFPFMRSATGLGWWDGNVERFKKYQYKVETIHNGKLENVGDTGDISVPGLSADFGMRLPTIDAQGSSIRLTYTLEEQIQMAGVKVFRANYLRDNFIEIHPVIIYSTTNVLTILDQSVVDKAQYSYYLVPFDFYGNRAIPGDTIHVYNARTSSIKALVTDVTAMSMETENHVLLQWKLSSEEDILSVDIYKALSYNDHFVRIGSVAPGIDHFKDYNVEPVSTSYYVLVVRTPFGKSYPSARVPVVFKANTPNTIPPQNLTATRRGNTVVLTWTKQGTDIRGYYLYRSTGYAKPMTPVTNVILTSDSVVTYIDSLATAPESNVLLYAVASENTSYSVSPISRRAVVGGNVPRLPIPPRPSAVIDGGSVLLFWEDLGNQYPQVKGYWIYRRTGDGETDNGERLRLNSEPTLPGVNSFLDTTILKGSHYFYSLVTVGSDTSIVSDAGMEAGAHTVADLPLPPGQLRIINSGMGILLQWTSPFDETVKGMRILRAMTGEEMQEIQMLTSTETEWLDENVLPDRVYYYQIVSVDKTGRQSGTAEPLGIYTGER